LEYFFSHGVLCTLVWTDFFSQLCKTLFDRNSVGFSMTWDSSHAVLLFLHFENPASQRDPEMICITEHGGFESYSRIYLNFQCSFIIFYSLGEW
jgi:hypothetical protein